MVNVEFIRDKWIPALRSEEYAQATGQLMERNGNEVGYCCLGVACDIIVKEQLIPGARWEDREVSHVLGAEPHFVVGDEADFQDLPLVVQEFLGITENGTVRGVVVDTEYDDEEGEEYEVYAESLIELNDEQEWSFRQIADVLELAIHGESTVEFYPPNLPARNT